MENYKKGMNNLDLDLPSQVEYNRRKNVEQDKVLSTLSSTVNTLVSQRPSGFLPRTYYGLQRGNNTYRFPDGATINVSGLGGNVGDAFELLSNEEDENYIAAIGVKAENGQLRITVRGDYNILTQIYDIVNMRTGEVINDYNLGSVTTLSAASYLGNYPADENIDKQITVLHNIETNEENIIFASVDFNGDGTYNWIRIGGYSSGIDGKSIYSVSDINISQILQNCMPNDSIMASKAFTYLTYNFNAGDVYLIVNINPLEMTLIGNIRGPQGIQGMQGNPGSDGVDGATPTIQDGYWYINGVNTNVKALGTDGRNGTDGQSFQIQSGLYSEPDNYGEPNNVGPSGETLLQIPTLPTTGVTGKGYVVYDSLTTPLNPYYDLYYANDGDSDWTIIHPFGGLKGEDGTNGYTPYIQDGYWYINGVNLNVAATGPRGPQGPTGPQGPQGPQGDPAIADAQLNENSMNAVANRAVAIKIAEMDEQIATNESNIQQNVSLSTPQTITASKTFEFNNDYVIIDSVGVEVGDDSDDSIVVENDKIRISDSNGYSDLNKNNVSLLNDIYNTNATNPLAFMLNVYPVGSIYLSTVNTNPGTLFGGTWERIQDRFLLGAGSSYSAGSTGGEATHTLTADEMPAHTHPMYVYQSNATDTWNGNTGTRMVTNNDVNSGNKTFWESQRMGNTGGGLPHNNMPPYLAVYMWKRTFLLLCRGCPPFT